jgi:TonB family protein
MKSPLGALPAIPAMTGAVVSELRPAGRTDSPLPVKVEIAASNIIILSHRRRAGAEAPVVALPADGRPAPAATPIPHPSPWLVLAGAALLHLAIAVGFFRSPPPMASVGLEAISVEIVLGANQAAGLAETPNESESVPSVAAPEIRAEQNKADRAEPETAEAQHEPEKTEAEPAPTTAEAKPAEPEALSAEIRPENKEPPKPAAEKPKPQKQKKPKQASASVASVNSAASGGIGQGRSTLDRNFAGMVAAHLARHKQYPAEARSRGITGTATITFALDGTGQVASVELVRSSGVPSLDTEAQAMVRRASPFPAPPTGQGVSFTVPVNFNLR